MHERQVHRQRLRVATVLPAAGITLLLVERLVLHVHCGAGLATWCWAAKEPYALVVHEASSTRALDTDGRDLALAPLLDEVDGLRRALSHL